MTSAQDTLAAIAGRAPREIDTGIFDLTAEPVNAHYDRIAPFYDPVMGSATYQRLAWRSSPKSYMDFAARVFARRSSGPHVELGCGSLLFTQQLYDRDIGRPVILIDQSVAMLRRARRRLVNRHGAMPKHVALVRADGRDLAVAAGVATTVLSMHVLHVVDEGPPLLRTLSSLGQSAMTTIGLTSIFLTGGRGDRFLRFMHRAGELAAPRDRPTIERLIAENVPGRAGVEVEGSMAFVIVSR